MIICMIPCSAPCSASSYNYSTLFFAIYAITKASILTIILYNTNIIISLVIGIIYPLFWLSILYEIIRSGSSISLLNRSIYNGSIYSNYNNIYISLFIILQLYILIIG